MRDPHTGVWFKVRCSGSLSIQLPELGCEDTPERLWHKELEKPPPSSAARQQVERCRGGKGVRGFCTSRFTESQSDEVSRLCDCHFQGSGEGRTSRLAGLRCWINVDPVLTVALTNSLALKLTSACHGSCSGVERLVAFGWTWAAC